MRKGQPYTDETSTLVNLKKDGEIHSATGLFISLKPQDFVGWREAYKDVPVYRDIVIVWNGRQHSFTMEEFATRLNLSEVGSVPYA